MTSDDAFVDHLKALAATGLRVEVDHSQVLQRGRRRRAARASTVTMLSITAVAGLATGVIALQPGLGDTSALRPAASTATPTLRLSETPNDHAVVDESQRSISLPIDEWQLSPQETAVIETATELAISRCMADAGYAEFYPFDGPVEPAAGNAEWNFGGYGVWIRAQVEEFGYGHPADKAPDFDPPSGIIYTEDARNARDVCIRATNAAGWTFDPTTIQAQAPTLGYHSANYTDAGKAVVDEWSQCLTAHGITPPDEVGSMNPARVLDAPLDEQIRVGRIDLDCKQSLNTVQKMADIDATEQLAYIESNKDYLEETRTAQHQLLQNARDYLAAAGVALT